MSAIGPELPPHLLNKHDDETKATKVTAGPQIPPEFLNQANDDDDDDDDYAPELPPDMASMRSTELSASIPPHHSPMSKRVVGPAIPSPSSIYNPGFSSLDDDDDDDFGPKPLPAGSQLPQTDAVKEFMEREENRRKATEEAAKPKALKRDEWMLVPPSSSDLLGKLDPTKLKARQFSRSTAPATKKDDNSLWTETPAERQQRLADEVSGKKRRAVDTQVNEETGDEKRRRTDEEFIRKGVDEYTQKIRGPSLLTQHTSSGKAESSTNKDSGIWDHSRDMSLGGRLMDEDKRSKIIKEARGLDARFGAGKSGGFL